MYIERVSWELNCRGTDKDYTAHRARTNGFDKYYQTIEQTSNRTIQEKKVNFEYSSEEKENKKVSARNKKRNGERVTATMFKNEEIFRTIHAQY